MCIWQLPHLPIAPEEKSLRVKPSGWMVDSLGIFCPEVLHIFSVTSGHDFAACVGQRDSGVQLWTAFL